MHKAKAAYAGKITLALSHSYTTDDAFLHFSNENFSPTSHKKLLASCKGIHQESLNYVQNILRSHKNSFGLDDDDDAENIFSFQLEVILQNFF